MNDLLMVIQRAAKRSPGPAAERSLAQARAFRAVCRSVDIPPPADRPGLLRVAPEELWCKSCGGEGAYTTWTVDKTSQYRARPGRPPQRPAVCMRCGGSRLVRVVECLAPGEFYVRG